MTIALEKMAVLRINDVYNVKPETSQETIRILSDLVSNKAKGPHLVHVRFIADDAGPIIQIIATRECLTLLQKDIIAQVKNWNEQRPSTTAHAHIELLDSQVTLFDTLADAVFKRLSQVNTNGSFRGHATNDMELLINQAAQSLSTKQGEPFWDDAVHALVEISGARVNLQKRTMGLHNHTNAFELQ